MWGCIREQRKYKLARVRQRGAGAAKGEGRGGSRGEDREGALAGKRTSQGAGVCREKRAPSEMPGDKAMESKYAS
eukprot:3897631-Pleurochrysis_carterae.AAC.1